MRISRLFLFSFPFSLLLSYTAHAQIVSDTSLIHAHKKILLKLDPELKDSMRVSSSERPLTGVTSAGTVLRIDSRPVTVYNTGGFGTMLHLKPGLNLVKLELRARDSSRLDTSLRFVYIVPRPATETRDFKIDEIRLYPSEDQHLVSGDVIKIRVKAQTGNQITFLKNVALTELPAVQAGGIKGIYQTNYVVTNADTMALDRLNVTMISPPSKVQSKRYIARSQEKVAFNENDFPEVARTKGPLPYLNFGLGTDRLGGAKLGYLDTLVRMKISGKSGNHYRVELSAHQRAWVADDLVDIMPKGTFFPACNTGNISTSTDTIYDYVKLGLCERLPYSSDLKSNPGRILVDIYGATSNTNWVIQHLTTPAIRGVNTEQLEVDLFRITIDLAKEQSWGYAVYYEGHSQLVIRIKRTPAKLDLHNLVIAVDAGHGGRNVGARSITGVYEKDFTLAMASELKKALEMAGAKVMMTRNADLDLTMVDRVKVLRSSRPDMLISIHANSSDDPGINGNSTYYRYEGFRALSLAIYKKVLTLGLGEYGNVGRFNFALSGPTDYPNALVETAFLSSPADESRLLDPAFKVQLAQKIVEGINDFLKGAGKVNPKSAHLAQRED